MKGIVTP
jgi:hypothetical protein